MPVLLIVGERDTKYVAIAERMHSLLPDAQLAIIPNAGHTVHLEQPTAFGAAVAEFLGQRVAESMSG
jgi:2-succinyl-6-hydroxy-2,4-cyclohexadiene-1-carboxylate synthase